MQIIRECVKKVFVIAYRESTEALEMSLKCQGVCVEVLRQKDTPDIQALSPSYKCFLNHREAWRKTADEVSPVLILEADFIPVKNFWALPLPYPISAKNIGISWLYTCGPRMYSVADDNYIQGGSTSLVAYIINNVSAKLLFGGFSEECAVRSQHGKVYYPFDSAVDDFLIRKGLKNYIAYKNYGEHGGISNPEHAKQLSWQYRLRSWNGSHRADVLCGELAFLPRYASGSKFRYRAIRTCAWLKGVLRLVTGRYLRLKIIMSVKPFKAYRMIRLAIGRLF